VPHGGYRDITLAAHQHQLHRSRIVTTIDQHAIAAAVHDFRALSVPGRFLDADDVVDV
jgi:hypothetical protein